MDEDFSDSWPSVDEATEAIRGYERAARDNPDDAQMRFDYGMVFMELGSGLEDHAIEAFKAAAQIRPAWAAVYSQLGQRQLAS